MFENVCRYKINLDRYNTPYMRLIMKFGGRAVDSGEKVLHVANLIKNYKNRGREIVGVSQQFVDGMTDEILESRIRKKRQ